METEARHALLIIVFKGFFINTESINSVKVIYESPSRKECSDRSLVLLSQEIPFDIVLDAGLSLLVVPAEFAERAKFELWQYEQENVQPKVSAPRITLVYQNAIPGIIGYIAVISIVALLAGEAAFDRNWFVTGRVDGVLIRTGEWWRSITALTLHSGLKHYAGNLGFGVVFGFMAGRIIGSGVTWLAVVLSACAANLLNTLLLESSHRSIGASTAVFAVLGIVAGFVWRGRIMKQERWAYRIGPVVGGLALLAYTGTGDANTDVGAHVTGFACGFAAGMVLTMMYRYISHRNVQLISGGLALAIISAAWMFALRI